MTEQEPDVGSSRAIWTLGRYFIVAELGRGGMAEVYLAMARGPSGFSKLVVLKLLRAQYAEEAAFVEMFLAEARLAARLNHPNVVQTYEVAVEGGRQCIVMEYLDGRTLAETWKGPKMPLPIAARVLADALAGLHHAHELVGLDGAAGGLVHRDVSPQNVMMTYDGQVKVLDFGIAKANDSVAQTRTGIFKGKVRYAAPERIIGGEIDRRSDIFSMGVLLWETATRRRMWGDAGDMAVMHRLATGEPFPPPSAVDGMIPAAIDAICARALSARPEDRYATALEMQDALEEYVSSTPVPITRRSVAKFMTDAFAEVRDQFQRDVDEQVRLIASAPAPANELSASISRVRAGVPRLGPALDTSSVSLMSIAGAAPVILSSRPPPPAAPRGLGRLLVSTVVALALTGAGALWLATRKAAPQTAPTASQTAVTSAPPPVVSASPAPTGDAPATTASGPGAPESGSPAPTRRWWASPPRVAPRPKATPTQAVAPDTPRREVDCTSPYYVDEQGLKKIRAECL
jgi:serine/threonine-protein kinase